MRERINRVRDRLAAGEVPIGMVAQLAAPEVVEIIGASGFDHVWIDWEHGSFDLEIVVHMCRAADAVGVTPVVRVPSHAPSTIMRALDAGAMGIIAPHVESAAEARAIVNAAKFNRDDGISGTRGACPGSRAAWHQARDWPRFTKWSNQTTMVWLIIETVKGVENFQEIIGVPGIDAIIIGAFDLSQDMGHDGDTRNADVARIVRELTRTAVEHDVHIVANVFSEGLDVGADARDRLAEGASILCIGSDRRLMGHAFAADLENVMAHIARAASSA